MQRAAFLLIASIFLSLPGWSQIDYNEFKKATNKIYIKDVMLHTKPGETVEYGAIVIENGIITEIGKSITKPTDARELKADSLYVYPAFIDGMSHIGMESKEEDKDKDSPKVKFPGAPSNKAAGITPEKLASESLGKTGIKDLREAGFGISHVVPKGNMLPGQTAIISLSSKEAKDVVIQDSKALYSQIKSSPGVFPSTMIGVITKWKELYKQAEGAKVHYEKYNQSSNGMSRPAYEDAVEAFIPVVEKKQKVFFKSPKIKDVHRVLALQKELGFELVLTDLSQIYPLMDKLDKADASLLLSMKLPEAPEKEEEKEEGEEEEGKEGDEKEGEEKEEKEEKEDKKEKEEPVDEEMEKMKERKKEAYQKYIVQAAELEKRNIPFGFSWLEGKAKDLHGNIRTLIENGLSEETALAALTTNPAEILDISHLAGTLEKGKLGNLMISNKPYFDEKAKVKFMIVDGEVFEYEIKEKKKSKGGEDVDIAGTWDYETNIPGNSFAGKLIITKNEDEYTVTMTREDEPGEDEEIDDVTVDGSNLVFGFQVSEGGFSMDIEIDLDFTAEDFEGTIAAGEFGSFPMEGTKVSPE